MTNNQLTSTHLAVKSELDGYKIHASRGQATAMAMVRLFESIDRDLEELQERRKAAMDSKPVAYISKSDFDAGYPHILARRDFNKACNMAVYAAQPAQPAQPAQVVPDDVSIFEAAIEECKTCDSIDEHAWNHGVLVVMAKYESCRAAMLQAKS